MKSAISIRFQIQGTGTVVEGAASDSGASAPETSGPREAPADSEAPPEVVPAETYGDPDATGPPEPELPAPGAGVPVTVLVG